VNAKFILFTSTTGLILIILLAMGCADVGYYQQAVSGQWQLLSLRRPLAAVRDDPATPVALRERLVLAETIREFAVRELRLPDNGSYQSYVDLARPYVVRNVFAAPPLSLEPKTWCFPVAGCVGYRGYFDEAGAERTAAELRTAGYDVFIGNVPAYSTLGWFSDPLLNTFIDWHPGRLAELLFHELAHQRLYVPGDTAFNESFATFVGRLGARRFLIRYASDEDRDYYERLARVRQQFYEVVAPTKAALAALYVSDLSSAAKREEKARLLAELVARYEALKAGEWEGFNGFDRWFYQDLNNAKLASLRAYTHWVPAFRRLYEDHGEDLERFYIAVEALANLEPVARIAALERQLTLASAQTGEADEPEAG